VTGAVPRLHADEVELRGAVVRGLVDAQFPAWRELPLEAVRSAGTQFVLYRLGGELVLRLPRTPGSARTLEVERRWLPRIAQHVPLAVPVPVAEGAPADGYPFPWSVYRWLGGDEMTAAPVGDEDALAADLADFLAALWRLEAGDGPRPGPQNANRGAPLRQRDGAARAAITKLGRAVPAGPVSRAWEAALEAPVWSRGPVWLHGDLDARNLLVTDARLSGVIDFGCLGVGDPACDVMVAWKVLTAGPRERFRLELQVDDATWERARGWVISQAVIALAYYTMDTNATLVTEARRWLGEALGPT
jgi:aminoglycoside phosphotransferase (APT) family kinase protein